MRIKLGKWAFLFAVTCLMFAFAASAFAATGSTYATWGSVSGLPGQGTSPHGGYTTTTVKCKVCHAVHNADVPGGELLLRGTVGDACNYCHVGGAGGYTQVYGGNPANYSGTDFSNAHNSWQITGVEQGVTCNICHQVHAADIAMTSNAYLTTKLLKGDKTYLPFPSPNYDPAAMEPLSTDTSNTALTKWCAGCHFTRTAGTVTYYGDNYNGQSHVMTAAVAAYDNSAVTFNGQVAWLGSNDCASCHNSQYTTNAWPHYTTGVRFLVSGATSTQSVAATNSAADGVCLRCHRNGTNGIGLNF
jgi:nitrate/TMAO reductase-like tetraheme cytochrome c subunit